MRLLVFAHVPPPFHGQSYMVRQMLENLGSPHSTADLELYHVNAQLSDGIEDVGSWRLAKVGRLAKYIGQAWLLRVRHGIDAFYYVPAPAKRGALYRDWIVLFLVGSLFRIRIFHWHATGLGQWVKEANGPLRRFEAWLTTRLYSRHELSCVLNEWGRGDVEVFQPGKIAVVANGIADPCPDFDSVVLSARRERWQRRAAAAPEQPARFCLLFLAHVTRSKGLFDAIDALALANARLAENGAFLRLTLTVAGATVDAAEEAEFLQRMSADDLLLDPSGKERAVGYAGFVDRDRKAKLLREADALVFPSFFLNEGQPVSVIEALAHGLPVLLSRWRALPEVVPPALAYLVEPANPARLADLLLELPKEDRFADYRACYLERYTLAAHCAGLRRAFGSVAK